MTTRAEIQGRQEKIIGIIDDLYIYWPLTVRQCFYQMVAAGHIENSKEGYGQVQRALKELRESDQVKWEAFQNCRNACYPLTWFAASGRYKLAGQSRSGDLRRVCSIPADLPSPNKFH